MFDMSLTRFFVDRNIFFNVYHFPEPHRVTKKIFLHTLVKIENFQGSMQHSAKNDIFGQKFTLRADKFSFQPSSQLNKFLFFTP